MENRRGQTIHTKDGKGDEVRRRNPSEGDPLYVCSCVTNVDVAPKCISQVFAEELMDVFLNQGSYNIFSTREYKKTPEGRREEGSELNGIFSHVLPKEIIKGISYFNRKEEKSFPNGNCLYCYGEGNNCGNIFPREIRQETLEGLANCYSEEGQKVLRHAKLSESGHPYHWKILSQFLDLQTKEGMQYIFPTKMLPFGIEGAREAAKYAMTKKEVAQRTLEVVGGEFAHKMIRRMFSCGIDEIVEPRHFDRDIVAKIAELNGFPESKEVVNKFRKAGGSLMYSLGYDILEPGALSQGFSNEWRISQAIKFYEAGVNTSLTVVCDVTKSLDENHTRGAQIKKALEAEEICGINVRVLPMRTRSSFVDFVLTGKIRDDIKSNGSSNEEKIKKAEKKVQGFFNEGFGDDFEHVDALVKDIRRRPFSQNGKTKELIANYMHPDFQRLYELGYGFCGTIGDVEYCDKCNLPGHENTRISFPVSELQPVKRHRNADKETRKENPKNVKSMIVEKLPLWSV